jgi:hypothetical protein
MTLVRPTDVVLFSFGLGLMTTCLVVSGTIIVTEVIIDKISKRGEKE